MADEPPLIPSGLTERSYELLVQAVVDYAIYMLDPQGRIMTWNVGAERIKGYKASEVIGQHLELFFPEEDRLQGKAQRLIATALREGRAHDEGWRVRKDGSRLWALTVLDAIHDEAGCLIGLAKITRDMTERHEAQLHLDEVRAQLFQAQKMEALGQLTGGMAHDFNNLLTVIIGSSDLARRSNNLERIQLLLENIHEAGVRGRELTQNLLTFARRRTPQDWALDLASTLQASSALFAQALPKGLSLELEIAPALHQARVDANQLEMALLNLVFNARDAMEQQGGRILLRAENQRLAGEWEDLHGDFVLISVSDDGPGIAPELQERIFEPFFTTKQFGKGTGLGLSQVYGFARNAGGAVRVESAPGKGTRMTICLPAAL
ncbi:PAS domain-containing sensor histidine kinase [Pseudomonas sp. SO81]|uniref:two-component system sensor histidine kinase NtrB n=1 Tax=Pseudomonas sp. SO81 TaxID=2983246 RepID=UPI0025A3FC0D|nr:PAS domain-containing sensor histidine kinase [Pseudomonas sp. SO81]WJN60156.1 Two-component system sensor histidine kinase/response regulator hybrid [Pseudomonas sp. SO81]